MVAVQWDPPHCLRPAGRCNSDFARDLLERTLSIGKLKAIRRLPSSQVAAILGLAARLSIEGAPLG